MITKTASEVFNGAALPGNPKNSKTFSKRYSNEQTQVGGNRLTGAWNPQNTHPGDFSKHPTHADRPSQHRIGATGFTGAVGDKVPFNNTNVRPLAGNHLDFNPRATNSLRNQHMLRATARDVKGLDTTSRRGGSSVQHFARPVAGTSDTYAVPNNVAGGRGNVQLVKVTSVHHFGLHKVVVTKHVPVSALRKAGRIS